MVFMLVYCGSSCGSLYRSVVVVVVVVVVVAAGIVVWSFHTTRWKELFQFCANLS